MWRGFQKPKRLAVDPDSLQLGYGRFQAQPFERGFGAMVGNSLRRVLLSSIEGAAITAVRIEGVSHEFSPIPSVTEDATDIILNLKQVPLKMHSEGPRTIRLRATEAGEIYSRQIEADSEVEILDPDVYLATVGEHGLLDIEMRVKRGRGYVSAESNYDDDLPIGFIPIDSVHSPVTKVNFTVEQSRLGQMNDFDKLGLEVYTNGAMTPQDAVGLAAKLIKDHMTIFVNFEEETANEESAEAAGAELYNENLNRSVEELELSVRSYNCLKNANIQTIGDLVVRTEADMLKTKNFGRKSLTEIRELLTTMGLGLGMRFDEQGRLIPPDSLDDEE
jgi:DNA-directed RNA polymerase subunit alpha